MDYYSFNRPRRDGWLSWPRWLTDSGRFTHKVVTRPAISLAQDRESLPARTGSLTTMLRHQLLLLLLLRLLLLLVLLLVGYVYSPSRLASSRVKSMLAILLCGYCMHMGSNFCCVNMTS